MSSQRGWPTSPAGLAGLALAAAAVVALPTPLDGQMMSRRATTIAAILKYPAFFHDKAITLVGSPVMVAAGELTGLATEPPRQFIIAPRTGRVPTRPVELRGRLLDIGRFASDDSRLGPLDLLRVVKAAAPDDRWPAREQLFVLTGATWTETEEQPIPTMRNIALRPEAFDGKTVVLRGRFRGRNLLGDLPAWPRQSEWDFVLQTADAAVWVVGKRPRGDGFDLTTTSRAHTGRWLEVTGRVEIVDDLPLIVADQLRTAEPQDEVEEPDVAPPPPLPAPDVVFTAPAQDETGISPDAVIQVQFSRPLLPESLKENIRVRYAEGVGDSLPEWTVTYRPGPVAAEIRFATPLASGVGVIVELTDGIQATDGMGLVPMTLRFTTSGAPR